MIRQEMPLWHISPKGRTIQMTMRARYDVSWTGRLNWRRTAAEDTVQERGIHFKH